eukprot:scaffold2905_cov97-Isochrysis_galbana.AAC.1
MGTRHTIWARKATRRGIYSRKASPKRTPGDKLGKGHAERGIVPKVASTPPAQHGAAPNSDRAGAPTQRSTAPTRTSTPRPQHAKAIAPAHRAPRPITPRQAPRSTTTPPHHSCLAIPPVLDLLDWNHTKGEPSASTCAASTGGGETGGGGTGDVVAGSSGGGGLGSGCAGLPGSAYPDSISGELATPGSAGGASASTRCVASAGPLAMGAIPCVPVTVHVLNEEGGDRYSVSLKYACHAPRPPARRLPARPPARTA